MEKEETYITRTPFRFKALNIQGKYYTLDGDKEISNYLYMKYENFTDKEVEYILQEFIETKEKLSRIESNIKNLLK